MLNSLYRLEIIVTLEGIVEPSGNTTQVHVLVQCTITLAYL
jgi:hypothetical protein